ncbi:uncharacterized protein AAG666_012420 isoform 2-T4 [Megaptera novaeangliae]
MEMPVTSHRSGPQDLPSGLGDGDCGNKMDMPFGRFSVGSFSLNGNSSVLVAELCDLMDSEGSPGALERLTYHTRLASLSPPTPLLSEAGSPDFTSTFCLRPLFLVASGLQEMCKQTTDLLTSPASTEEPL